MARNKHPPTRTQARKPTHHVRALWALLRPRHFLRQVPPRATRACCRPRRPRQRPPPYVRVPRASGGATQRRRGGQGEGCHAGRGRRRVHVCQQGRAKRAVPCAAALASPLPLGARSACERRAPRASPRLSCAAAPRSPRGAGTCERWCGRARALARTCKPSPGGRRATASAMGSPSASRQAARAVGAEAAMARAGEGARCLQCSFAAALAREHR